MKPQDLYAQLELIPTSYESPVKPAKSRGQQVWEQVETQVGQLAQSLLNYFVGSTEPKIVMRQDRNGETYYRVYDQLTHKVQAFYSEDDLRIWLDKRYYE